MGNRMACGLPVYDKSEPYTFDKNDERWPDYQALIVVTVLAKRDGIQIDEIEGKPLPDFKNLLITRDEAFKIFKSRHVMKPYPWTYPMEWLTSDFIGSVGPGAYEAEEAAETEAETTNQPPQKIHGNAERFAVVREKIAWACLAALAKYPEECRTKEGNVVATKLRECMEKHTSKLWTDGSPPIEPDTIERRIREALDMVK